MNNTRDFLIVGQQPWDTDIGSNCKNIALELSKRHRVLYVNSPLDRITLWRNRTDPQVEKRMDVIRRRTNGLIQVNENLWNLYPDCLVESINWISSPMLFDILNKRNNRLLAHSIRAAITSLGFSDVILFNDNELFKAFYLKDILDPTISIYYSRDYMLGVDYWKKHGTRLEPLLIGKSHLCFANSLYLKNYCSQYNPNSFYVGQGCDITLPSTTANHHQHIELQRIKSPIIGYVGSLDSNRLAIDVMEYIAVTLPNHSLVLVGPEDAQFRSSRLHQLENVHFLGKKPVQELALYISGFDVCINPQVVNDITIGNYPRKIDEYLALGKPVVATKTETMEIFQDVAYLTDTKEGYVTAITKALEEDDMRAKQARQALASSHTWENSVNAMLTEIDRYTANKPAKANDEST